MKTISVGQTSGSGSVELWFNTEKDRFYIDGMEIPLPIPKENQENHWYYIKIDLQEGGEKDGKSN